ncbi:exodeoxyribonuclease VII small subunit [Reinekea sp. MED297]|uniref:Exodeoxyribonuclease 7 small subunit n=2 Tax=Reinekea TaxID=230494 RepID=A4BG70_9GAMM|nr:exodeoxyribonuclease VII small subunit [Reinekea sp. MED297] [Reinekea blandensis MED297]
MRESGTIMSTKDAPSFEDNLAQLEAIVGQLESGDLSLDDAMKAFEQGIRLTRECQESLSTAEQKVQVLMAKNGEESLQPLNTNADQE